MAASTRPRSRSPSPPAREDQRQRRKTDNVAKAIEPDAFQYASDKLKADREFVYDLVKDDGAVLEHAADALKDDTELVVRAIETGIAGCYWYGDIQRSPLQFASERLRKDEYVVYRAVCLNGFAIKHADPSLLDNRRIILRAVQDDGRVLKCLDARWKRDRAIVIAAVTNSSEAFHHASDELQSDPEVLAAREEALEGTRF